MDSQKVADFYDEFSAKQQKLAFNERHFLMIEKLLNEGMGNNSSVLELGCGIGVITKLISTFNQKGEIISVDISKKNIEIARKNVQNKNVSFLCEDVTKLNLNQKFDFICLFDVLEHIPSELIEDLLLKLTELCNKNTAVIINIPTAEFIQHIQKHSPNELQIIDNPISTLKLIQLFSNNNFELQKFEKYDLFNAEESRYMMFKINKEFTIKPHKIDVKNIIRKYRFRKLMNFI